MQVSGGTFAQLALTQIKLSTSMLKNAAEAERNVANMISKVADQARGQNLDIRA